MYNTFRCLQDRAAQHHIYAVALGLAGGHIYGLRLGHCALGVTKFVS